MLITSSIFLIGVLIYLFDFEDGEFTIMEDFDKYDRRQISLIFVCFIFVQLVLTSAPYASSIMQDRK